MSWLAIKEQQTFGQLLASGKYRADLLERLETRMPLPTDSKARKEYPMYSGLMRYFPDALAGVAHVSFKGNQQHNPGQPLHWSRDKSNDHEDCVTRHLAGLGTLDTDGEPHSMKLAWRALAIAQLEYEKRMAGTVANVPEHKLDMTDPYNREIVKQIEEGTFLIEANTLSSIRVEDGKVVCRPASEGVPLPKTTRPEPLDIKDDQPMQKILFGLAEEPTTPGTVPSFMECPINFVHTDLIGQAFREALLETPICLIRMYEESREDVIVQLRQSDQDRLVSLGCPLPVAHLVVGGITYCEEAINGEPRPYVYIAGPMRGYEHFNFPAFDAARDHFLKLGYNVISPADIDRADGETDEKTMTAAADQTSYTFRDFYTLYFIAKTPYAVLGSPSAIAMLPGWEKSTGATAEFFLARWLDLKPYDQHGGALTKLDVGIRLKAQEWMKAKAK